MSPHWAAAVPFEQWAVALLNGFGEWLNSELDVPSSVKYF
jgi:hypothetical protein